MFDFKAGKSSIEIGFLKSLFESFGSFPSLLMSLLLWMIEIFGQVVIPSMGGRFLMRFIPVCDSIIEVWLLVPTPELPIPTTVNSSSPLTAATGLTRRTPYLER